MTHTPTQKPQEYYYFLDGWKGLFILWILISHSAHFLVKDWTGVNRIFRLAHSFLPFAVDIFFLITGFLTTKSMLRHNALEWNFLVNRAKRIVPIYVILLLSVFIALQFSSPFAHKVYHFVDVKGGQIYVAYSGATHFSADYEGFMPYLMFYQDYVNPISLLDHTWFLAVIVHFYLFFSVIIWAVYKLANDISNRKIILFFVFLFFAGLMIISRYNHFGNSYRTHLKMGAVLLGCLLRLGEEYYHQINNRLRVKCLPWASFAIGVSMFVFLMYVSYFAFYKLSGSLFILSYLAFSLMMIGTRGNRFLREHFFANAAIRWLGKNSYGIYLFHYPFIYYYIYFLNSNGIRVNPYLSLAICSMCAILLGWIIEKISYPIIKKGIIA